VVDDRGQEVTDAVIEPGLVALDRPGRYHIRATGLMQALATDIEVTTATLKSVAISPLLPTIANGMTQKFTLTGTFSDGTTQDVSALAAWSIKSTVGTGVATIDSSGLVTSEGAGKATITGRYDKHQASTSLTITAATITSLAISPAAPTVLRGGSVHFAATATLSDKTQKDVTSMATWSVQDVVGTAVASIDEFGTATGLAAGQAAISADYSGLSSSTTLTVHVPMGWTSVPTGVTDVLTGIWGSSSKDIWAVCAGLTGLKSTGILHYDGSAWTGVSPATPLTGIGLLGVWARAQDDAWAVGYGGTVLRWNGTSWTARPTGLTTFLQGAFGTSVNDVWFSGEQGKILHWDGENLAAVAAPTTAALIGLWGAAANDLWAVGDTAAIVHWNGTAWSLVPSPAAATETLSRVWGAAANDVWIVGTNGTILHWNGTAWSLVASGTTQWLHGVWGTSSTNVWAAGEGGVTLHWDGTSWTQVPSGVTGKLYRLWGADATSVWAGGENGILLNYQ
jgi:hypothetical protein